MLLQIECLKIVAFPQLFASLLRLKRLIVSKKEQVITVTGNFYFLQSLVKVAHSYFPRALLIS